MAGAEPGCVAYAGLQHNMPTRDPNLEPRRDTMCLLVRVSNVLFFGREAALPDVRGDSIPMTGVGVSQDKLYKIVPVLVTRDYSEGQWKQQRM